MAFHLYYISNYFYRSLFYDFSIYYNKTFGESVNQYLVTESARIERFSTLSFALIKRCKTIVTTELTSALCESTVGSYVSLIGNCKKFLKKEKNFYIYPLLLCISIICISVPYEKIVHSFQMQCLNFGITSYKIIQLIGIWLIKWQTIRTQIILFFLIIKQPGLMIKGKTTRLDKSFIRK